ncbi:MAG: DUF4442 domain-containing protein [Flavobacteriales bacterium]|nr:DUF4442 domain-containing protein [Flavobacteriales bacterium]
MDSYQKLVSQAKNSTFYKWVLNQGLLFKIPFNRPHGLKITRISKDGMEVMLPYKRKNFNHIKGMHACALATTSEYIAGLVLLRKLGTTKYRLIMESMHIKYLAQAKSDVTATFELTDKQVEEMVIQPLKNQESVMVEFTTTTMDNQGRKISEALTRWQIKPWEKVRTKI